MKRINILLTSVGRRSYLVKYFKEALGENGSVHVSNSSELSPAFQIADKAVVSPLIYSTDYIPFLLNYCQANDIHAIISLFDIDLPILSKHKMEFINIGVKVIVSDYESVQICNDKWKTYQFLLQNQLNGPKTFISLEKAIEAIRNGLVSFPLMVKPRWGMGSIAIFEAENEEELNVFYKKAKRNIRDTYLKYESAEDIEQSVIIQEKLKGQEYGLDIINDLDKNYITTIPKMKYAMRSGETDCAVTVKDERLKELGEKISSSLRHIANLDVDVFIVDGECYVLEMNARFGGGYPFSHMAGVNLPLAIVHWLKGECVEQRLLTERVNVISQKDINLVRLYIEPKTQIGEVVEEENVIEKVKYFEKMLIPPISQRGVDIEVYAKKLAVFGVVLILQNEKNEDIGLLAAYMNDEIKHTAYLSILSIDVQYRGLHLGERLLTYAEKLALEKGMQYFKLEVRKDNYSAIGFYEHFGFKIIEEASEDSYYMQKVLMKEEEML